MGVLTSQRVETDTGKNIVALFVMKAK